MLTLGALFFHAPSYIGHRLHSPSPSNSDLLYRLTSAYVGGHQTEDQHPQPKKQENEFNDSDILKRSYIKHP